MPYRTTPKLSEVLVSYQRVRAMNCAKTTVVNDRSVLRRFIEGVGDPQAHKLTAAACEDWFAGEAERQVATSYNKVRNRVIGFLSFCARRGYLSDDPMAEVGKRRTQARKPRMQLSQDQLRSMIELTTNARDRAMLATGANTGLRASDLVRLTVGDVDLDQGILRVDIQKTKDNDELPITADLETELRRWLVWYSDRLAAHGLSLGSADRLFPPLNRNVRVGREMVPFDPDPAGTLRHPARVVHRALERIGVTETTGEGFHTLRRSVGRIVFDQAAEEGHDGALRMTAALLGHKSVQTTELYLGIDRDRMKRNELMRGRSILGRAPTNVVPISAAT